MKRCAVIGSINMDLVIRTPHFPKPGQTIAGSRFETIPGGKGANQAIALARLGVPVMMAGMVGGDAFGQRYLEHFRSEGVDVSAVGVHPDAPTGVADILIDAQGENCIVVVPGANGMCDEAWLDAALERVSECDIVLLQLELPLETVKRAVQGLRAMGKTVILDPAPAAALPQDVLECVDYLTPNETELEALTSFLPAGAAPQERIAALIGDSDRVVVNKHGAQGAYIGTKDGVVHVPGFEVAVVDTTAAGDTFNAGFAAGLIRGLSLYDAVRMGNAAGALAVTAFGAQGGMPTMARAEEMLGR